MLKARRSVTVLAAAVLLAFATLAQARIQMCKDANGRPVFSDLPCGPDAKPIEVNPASGRLDAAPSERLEVEYYDVRGSTWAALRQQIDNKGPEGWWGVTHSFTRYRFTPRMTPAGCVADDVTVQADARVRLPNWADRYAGPRRMQVQWDNVIRTLDLHERGHVEINLQGSREVERALKSMPPQASCEALAAEARRRYDEIHATVRRRQAAYDEDNDHGRRQWTPYHD